MRAFLVNVPTLQCGVSAFGRNLYDVLKSSERIVWDLIEVNTEAQLRQAVDELEPDAILYNWQSGQGGYLADAPFSGLGPQALSYHDLPTHEERWDAILFADPNMHPNGKWYPIGRPIPQFKYFPGPKNKVFTVGCYGLVGAWADRVVDQVLKEFEFALIRLNLPCADHGDPDGAIALTMADRCRSMVVGTGVTLEISHCFLPQIKLLEWLSQNDINCFFRDVNVGWRGVSSAPDCALAARRPIAVNRCSAFRHLHGLSPSICIEDSNLTQIIGNGLSPLAALYQKWDQTTVRKQVEDVLCVI